MPRVEPVRQHHRLVRREDGVLGEAAVAMDPRRHVPRAEVDLAAPAGVADPAPVVGIAGDERPLGEAHPGAAPDHPPGELVPERHRRRRGELALEEVPVGPADAGRLHPDQHLARPGLRHRHLLEAQVADGMKARRKHGFPLSPDHGTPHRPLSSHRLGRAARGSPRPWPRAGWWLAVVGERPLDDPVEAVRRSPRARRGPRARRAAGSAPASSSARSAPCRQPHRRRQARELRPGARGR